MILSLKNTDAEEVKRVLDIACNMPFDLAYEYTKFFSIDDKSYMRIDDFYREGRINIKTTDVIDVITAYNKEFKISTEENIEDIWGTPIELLK